MPPTIPFLDFLIAARRQTLATLGGPITIDFMDRMLTPEQAADWLQMPEGELWKKIRTEKIAHAKFGHKTARLNPRTVIATSHRATL